MILALMAAIQAVRLPMYGIKQKPESGSSCGISARPLAGLSMRSPSSLQERGRNQYMIQAAFLSAVS